MGKIKVGLVSVFAMCVMIAIGSGDLSSREIRVKILQQKLGRLYFSAGKDEDVWPGCRWRILKDSSDKMKSISEGVIAESYEGVSISDSTISEQLPLETMHVAKIDAVDTAHGYINVFVSIDHIARFTIPWIRDILVRQSGDRLDGGERASEFQGQPVLQYSLDTGRFGVILTPTGFNSTSMPLTDSARPEMEISYSQCDAAPKSIAITAPHLVALIPNVSRPVNRNALLTTALRYRIDTSQINNAFEFESVPQLSFLPGAHSYSAFTADISKAKKLLKENKSAGASVSIDTYSPTLKSTSRYIQGTLTQAGYATKTVGWNEPADLQLAILPIYSDSPWVALREVLTSIAKDTVEKDRANQPVRLAGQLLKDALTTSDSTRRMQLLERVDRMLMEDIGAFPLFRPIIYVCAKEEIRGIKFDKDGRLDLRSIYRLKLPTLTTEAER